ncbi:hypothetical protein BDN67DRAFT_1017104 [Paxillus ammoniavirescens]|nr:hypothetical protein BDN67DRAFT_1017104 [Paxillus ammoniavirescens]
MGASASNCEGGIRNYVYSLDTVVNPSTYKTLDKPGYWGVHTIRCFRVVQQRLFATHNFLKTLLPPAPNADGSLPPNYFYRPQTFNSLTGHANPLVLKHSNMLLMQLALDGMKLQPCAPGFFDAGAAIIQVDEILTGGENAGALSLWEGFAERGLGVTATVVGSTPWGGGVRQDGSKVPPKC